MRSFWDHFWILLGRYKTVQRNLLWNNTKKRTQPGNRTKKSQGLWRRACQILRQITPSKHPSNTSKEAPQRSDPVLQGVFVSFFLIKGRRYRGVPWCKYHPWTLAGPSSARRRAPESRKTRLKKRTKNCNAFGPHNVANSIPKSIQKLTKIRHLSVFVP